MDKRNTSTPKDKEKRILDLLEQAKRTNDFIKFDKYLKELHKLRANQPD
jgi:hypothetical protein